MTEMSTIFVKPFRSDVRAALVEDAEATGIGVNERAALILAETYGVPMEPSGRKPRETSDLDVGHMLLRLPGELATRIRLHSVERGVPLRVIILRALAAHYALPPEPLVDGRVRSGRRKASA